MEENRSKYRNAVGTGKWAMLQNQNVNEHEV